jgi:hypothetical protein
MTAAGRKPGCCSNRLVWTKKKAGQKPAACHTF